MSDKPERLRTEASKTSKPTEPAKPITLRQLAAHLGLDPSTVSVVLNDNPGRSIRRETRDRIKAAAKELNYRPSLLARSLRRQDTRSVGVLLPSVADEYHAQVLSGIATELERNGYSYLIAQHRHDPLKQREYMEMLLSRGAQALIVIDTQLKQGLHVPVVAVAGHGRVQGVTNLCLNHERAAELTMTHLYGLGHRRIAVIRGQPFSSDTNLRWRATSAAARALGIAIPRHLVMQLDREIASPEVGYAVVDELLKKSRDFSAIVCFNDLAALGAIRALGDAGLRTPDDVSVVGFDDIRMAVFARPSLTTIRQPLQSMGESAAGILLQCLRSGNHSLEDLAIEPELIVRESTALVKKQVLTTDSI